MSDEPQPPSPSLRLRPRLSAGEPEASAEAGATVSNADPSASSKGPAGEGPAPQTMKVRLRPRLSAEGTANAPRAEESSGLPSAEPLPAATIPPSVPTVPAANVPTAELVARASPIRLKPRIATAAELGSPAPSSLTAPGAPPSATVPDVVMPSPSANDPALSEVEVSRKPLASEGGKLKLRSADALIGDPGLLVGALPGNSAPGGGASPSSVTPAPIPVVKRTPPPFPVLDTAPKRPPAPRIPHLAARESPSALHSESSVRKPRGTPFLVILLGLAVAGGGAYFGWTHFKKTPSAAAPSTSAPSPVTPSETLNALASVPAQAIQKAQEVIASRQEKAGSAVDAVVADQEGIAKQGPRAPAPVPVSPPPMAGTTATTTVAPGLSASMPIAAAADASAAFREFIANAKISGVAETRALINGRLVRTGEVVDSTLGIRFHAVDRETKQLIFRDFTGAQVGRRY